jgi:hypothetical protein
MSRSALLVALVGGLAAVPAAADGATLKFGRSCYVSSEQMVGLASGFRANARLTLDSNSDWIDNLPAKADRAGKVRLTFFSPNLRSGFGIKRETLTLTDPRAKSHRARTTVFISNFLADWGKQQDPRVSRTWRFVGFRDPGTMYGHFVFDGKVVATHRFGDPAGPCGRMNARAPGLPVPKSKIRAGHWTLQFDMNRQYREGRAGSLQAGMDVPARYSTGR